MNEILDKLTFAVFEFTLVPERAVEFTGFKGNVFRGALGKTLRTLTCVFKDSQTACNTCFVREKCIYSKLFESPHVSDGSVLGPVENAPHPFVLYVPEKYRQDYPGDSKIHVFLTLIGEAIEYIPYFILVLEEMGKKGIGNTRTPFKVATVLAGETTIYNPEEKKIIQTFPVHGGGDFATASWPAENLVIHLLTPTRLKFARQFQKFITFEMLLRNLLRRIQLLNALYCGGPARVDFMGLIKKAGDIATRDAQIHWEQQSRFSFRQEQTVTLGGVSGWLEVAGELTPFMPFLRVGEYLHVGKSTAFGLGKIGLARKEINGSKG